MYKIIQVKELPHEILSMPLSKCAKRIAAKLSPEDKSYLSDVVRNALSPIGYFISVHEDNIKICSDCFHKEMMPLVKHGFDKIIKFLKIIENS